MSIIQSFKTRFDRLHDALQTFKDLSEDHKTDETAKRLIDNCNLDITPAEEELQTIKNQLEMGSGLRP